MQEKQFCCCGSSGWTRFIGWLQLAGSIMGIFSAAIFVIGPFVLPPHELEKLAGNPSSPVDRQQFAIAKILVSIAGGFFVVLYVVSAIMAIFLLKGVQNKNAKYLQAWLVFTVISLLITVILILALCFYAPEDGPAWGAAAFLISMVLLIQGFCIWVVETHKNEMKGQAPIVYSS